MSASANVHRRSIWQPRIIGNLLMTVCPFVCRFFFFVSFLCRVALVRGVAAYNFSVDDLSVCASVCLCVGRSVQCMVEKRRIGSGCRLAS